MNKSAYAFVAFFLLVAGGILVSLPSRLVQFVDGAVANGELYALDPQEQEQLRLVLETAANLAEIGKQVAINEKYDPDRLNIYIVRSTLSPEEDGQLPEPTQRC